MVGIPVEARVLKWYISDLTRDSDLLTISKNCHQLISMVPRMFCESTQFLEHIIFQYIPARPFIDHSFCGNQPV